MDVETPEARHRGTLVAVVRNAVRTHSGGGTQAAGIKRQRKTSNLPPNMCRIVRSPVGHAGQQSW